MILHFWNSNASSILSTNEPKYHMLCGTPLVTGLKLEHASPRTTLCVLSVKNAIIHFCYLFLTPVASFLWETEEKALAKSAKNISMNSFRAVESVNMSWNSNKFVRHALLLTKPCWRWEIRPWDFKIFYLIPYLKKGYFMTAVACKRI